MALMTFALLARQQSIEKQTTHWKVFWYPRPKQSLLLVIAFSSGMLLTGCGDEEYASLEEAQERVCSSPPCPQLCLECVNQRWASLVSIDKETIHHWFQHCADASKKSCSERLADLRAGWTARWCLGHFEPYSLLYSQSASPCELAISMWLASWRQFLPKLGVSRKLRETHCHRGGDHHLPRLNLPFWMFWWLCIYHSRFSLEMLHLSWLYISIC